jgi:hypothetical protein
MRSAVDTKCDFTAIGNQDFLDCHVYSITIKG